MITPQAQRVTGKRRAARVAQLVDNSWVAFGLRRTGRFLASIVVLITAAFLLIHLVPGDPVRAALGPSAPLDLVEARREALGLNNPLHIQFFEYVTGLFRGDLGTSITSGLPVADVIAERLSATAVIAGLAFVVAILIAAPVGLGIAILTRGQRRGSLDAGFTWMSVLVGAIPEFLVGIGLVAVFAVTLGWFPVAGRSGPESYILPVIALAIGPAAIIARILRVEALAVMNADFVRTTRAKRLRPRLIHLRHVLPNTLTATLTVAGLLLGGMAVGTVLVESIFAWPGLGSRLVQSIISMDYPVVQALVLVYGAGILLINLVVDVLLAWMDPRSTMKEV
ncbi:ABC transporter permease [uncultured Agrococcus sp.]|uniref:ABC transporter permease n=1 Tax=uncultured Agrococcus sp. TaxID=382258 RepID=UPI0025FED074|nr:ABC transporter permease [uncultured Agrococcus sp.]